ncbi:glycosyltransferase family 47 protein [Gonapodya prolifera JEL478]|uniref:Glycosyltransferase family 47 protein n=1 Tax=Gonapodya prolifera (strain JEL478) TaxID=1344416 RepID=A0A139ARH2_GONPJ|nr:glycosyltransferase family 47 protein [Gonapodya prolifera JEL478]|eukprot:KXS19254.1 glycosyltransferase family 47 protein [Gonapodya prolifera JEL478]
MIWLQSYPHLRRHFRLVLLASIFVIPFILRSLVSFPSFNRKDAGEHRRVKKHPYPSNVSIPSIPRAHDDIWAWTDMPPFYWRKLCNMYTCFDFDLCRRRKGFRAYVYPRNATLPVAWFQSEALLPVERAANWSLENRNSPLKEHKASNPQPIGLSFSSKAELPLDHEKRLRRLITHDPEQACLFIPSLDLSCAYNQCLFSREFALQHMESLSYWNFSGTLGKNHILFQVQDPDPGQLVAHSIVVSTNFYANQPRVGFDVTMPLRNWKSLHHLRLVDPSGNIRRGGASWLWSNSGSRFHAGQPPNERNPFRTKYLLTFKGSRYHDKPLRTVILQLHNNEDIISVAKCSGSWPYMNLTEYNPMADCEKTDPMYAKYDYDDLLVNTTFSALVGGYGVHEYRFYETLSTGAIPVIFYTPSYPLPFSEVIDYRSIAVFFNVEELETEQGRERITTYLRHLATADGGRRVWEIKRRIADLFDRYMVSWEAMMATVLEIIESRYRGGLADLPYG